LHPSSQIPQSAQFYSDWTLTLITKSSQKPSHTSILTLVATFWRRMAILLIPQEGPYTLVRLSICQNYCVRLNKDIGTGALLSTLSSSLKRNPIVLGKPEQPMLDVIVMK
jgi:hypothetical protein